MKNLPNATTVLVLGIVSIVCCWCFGIVGIICGAIALSMAKKDLALVQAGTEGEYSNYSALKTGRILAIIGLILSIIYFLFTIGYWLLYGALIGSMMMDDPFMYDDYYY
ncbi:MAG: CCC motif membrane protein [Bacteroidetes bacterium]|nr:CCC motif membrane protein [Bacteroidota bacterium]MDA1336507.1 CCC motif membrane protein [Bacteroidota bacterium]